MEAVGRLPHDSPIKLLVFGPVIPELRPEFEERLNAGDLGRYVPWAGASDAYDYFAAGDIAAFPGKHSVYWEQAAGLGKPLLVRRLPGFEHVDRGDNVIYLDEASHQSICDLISSLPGSGAFDALEKAASENARYFRYSEIARKSIC